MKRNPHSHVSLEAVATTDLKWLQQALGRWGCSLKWSKVWGQTPSPAALSQLLWDDVIVQRVVRAGRRRPVALLQAVNLHYDDGVADLELLIDPNKLIEVDVALRQFIRQVLEAQPIRKLSLAVAADDMTLPSYLAAVAHQAGCLVDHLRRGRDSFVDVNIYEIWGHVVWDDLA